MTAVTYAKDFAELSRKVEQESYLSSFPFMLQELVQGTGRGLFTLYQDESRSSILGIADSGRSHLPVASAFSARVAVLPSP